MFYMAYLFGWDLIVRAVGTLQSQLDTFSIWLMIIKEGPLLDCNTSLTILISNKKWSYSTSDLFSTSWLFWLSLLILIPGLTRFELSQLEILLRGCSNTLLLSNWFYHWGICLLVRNSWFIRNNRDRKWWIFQF